MARKSSSSQIKLGLYGSTGKMGHAVRELIKKNAAFENQFHLYLEVSSQPSLDFDLSYTTLAQISDEILKQVDVWIDFSQPDGLIKLLLTVSRFGTPVVSGTTGLSQKQNQTLQLSSKKIPLFWASNMSAGLWAFRQAIKSLEKISNFDFVIEEIHHTHKKDNPSGTAMTLHQDLEKIAQKKIKMPTGHRLGGVFGVHTVMAASPSEILKFEHTAMNRTVFAEGAIKAAMWIVNQRSGLYSMDDLMLSQVQKPRRKK